MLELISMAISPEVPRPEPEIQEIPTAPEIPPEIEKGTGVRVVQKNFTAQVKNDKGVPLIATPPTQVISVTPPANTQTLTSWAKGPITQSISWLGLFWLRILKKAMHFGWHIGKEQK